MAPGKLISIIAVLILLALAAEGGYYWGFNRGLKNAPGPVLTQTQTPTPAAFFSGKDSADVQSTLEALSLLFKPQVIDHLKNIPAEAVWWSGWTIAIGGKLTSLSDKEISLELTPEQGIKTWTLPPSVRYQIYNETTRQTNDAPKEAIQLGDTVGFSVDFDTQTGEIGNGRITKSVK